MNGVDWGAISAIGTTISTGVIAITAFFALAQLRQMHRASQFDVTRKMIDEIKKPAFAKAWTYVISEFPQRADDPAFKAEFESSRSWEIDIDKHPEMLVLAYLEEVGIYVKQRLIAENALLDFNSGLIIEGWERLRGVVEQMRRSQNPHAGSIPNTSTTTRSSVNAKIIRELIDRNEASPVGWAHERARFRLRPSAGGRLDRFGRAIAGGGGT